MTAPSTRTAPSTARDAAAGRATASAATRRVKRVLLVVAAAVISRQLFVARDWFGHAFSAVAGAAGSWVLIAAVAVGGSVLGFSAVRVVTIRSTGTSVSLSGMVGLTVAAGALNATLPGGAVFSTAYAFRALRTRGLSIAAATWSLTITGVVSTVSLVVLVCGAGLLGGGSSGIVGTLVEVGALGLFLWALVAVTRDPRRLLPVGTGLLHLVNRCRRRSAQHGVDGLHRIIGGLSGIRPTGRQALLALTLSLITWLFEITCLLACLAAVGVEVPVAAVVLSYAAGKAVTSVSPLPAGIGVVEGAMVVGLTAAGAPAAAALAGVLIFRLLAVGGVAVVGWTVLGLDRVRAGRPGVVLAAV